MRSSMSSRSPSTPKQDVAQWRDVESSHIASLRYEELAQALYIRFRSGAAYCYTPVLPATFYRMLEAPSIGAFFHCYIKSSYRCILVEEEPDDA